MFQASSGRFNLTSSFTDIGLTEESLSKAIAVVHETLDAIDTALLSRNSDRLAEMVELANLSSMIGNLLRTGISKSSSGIFCANGPHKHPDLLHTTDPDCNVEIKVALEDNAPKGHLAKAGLHLTCHYVLCKPDGTFSIGTDKRGAVPRIWLIRFGYLDVHHFNISNTQGDSGKTAVINAEGIRQLEPIFFTPDLCAFPVSKRSTRAKQLFDRFNLSKEFQERVGDNAP